jgi:hypothetical protein
VPEGSVGVQHAHFGRHDLAAGVAAGEGVDQPGEPWSLGGAGECDPKLPGGVAGGVPGGVAGSQQFGVGGAQPGLQLRPERCDADPPVGAAEVQFLT